MSDLSSFLLKILLYGNEDDIRRLLNYVSDSSTHALWSFGIYFGVRNLTVDMGTNVKIQIWAVDAEKSIPIKDVVFAGTKVVILVGKKDELEKISHYLQDVRRNIPQIPILSVVLHTQDMANLPLELHNIKGLEDAVEIDENLMHGIERVISAAISKPTKVLKIVDQYESMELSTDSEFYHTHPLFVKMNESRLPIPELTPIVRYQLWDKQPLNVSLVTNLIQTLGIPIKRKRVIIHQKEVSFKINLTSGSIIASNPQCKKCIRIKECEREKIKELCIIPNTRGWTNLEGANLCDLVLISATYSLYNDLVPKEIQHQYEQITDCPMFVPS